MPNISSLPRNAAIGAVVGALLGILLIGVGLIRAGITVVSGGHMQPVSAQDKSVLAYYLVGFAIAGAVAGAARSTFSKKVAIVLGCMLGGMIVVFAILVGEEGSIHALTEEELLICPVLGVVFGAAAAAGILSGEKAS